MDFFKDVKNARDLMHVNIEIPEEIPDKMPKYATSMFERLKKIKSGDPSLVEQFIEADSLGTMKEIQLKNAYNQAGMYAFISWQWVTPFIEWLNGRKVLEVMAGRGWWTYALRQKGVDVIATDDFSWDYRSWMDTLTEVEEMDAIEAVEKYGKEVDVVTIGWPYMDNTAYRVIKRLHEVNPDALVVYIGEQGGCTADEAFHQHFNIDFSDTEFNKVTTRYQSWDHIHDRIFLGKYSE